MNSHPRMTALNCLLSLASEIDCICTLLHSAVSIFQRVFENNRFSFPTYYIAIPIQIARIFFSCNSFTPASSAQFYLRISHSYFRESLPVSINIFSATLIDRPYSFRIPVIDVLLISWRFDSIRPF